MDGAVNTVMTVETAVAAVKQHPKSKEPDDGSFKSMLSEAVNGTAKSKPDETSRRQETQEKASKEPETVQVKPMETIPDKQAVEQARDGDDIDIDEYVNQAVTAAMQIMLPVIAETPQTEIPADTNAMAAGEPVVKAINPASETLLDNTAQTDILPSDATARETPVQPDGANNTQAVKPHENPERQAKPDVRTAERIKAKETETAGKAAEARPREKAIQTEALNGAQRVRPRIEAQSQTEGRENTIASGERPKEPASGIEPQNIEQAPRFVQMHNMRHTHKADTEQSRFDAMMSKATRELNKGATHETTLETEIPKETPTQAHTGVQAAEAVKPESKTETPEAEMHQKQEPKPVERVETQKSVKAPVTVQRPQKELSESDEAVLGMVQQKAPDLENMEIRAEPEARQPAQAQMPDQSERIKAQVITNLENERTEFQMQLRPEELGKINVKMILEDGKLSVEIAAVNQKSAEMLSKQAESLIASLKAGNIDVTSVNVVAANENTSGHMDGEYNLNNFQNQFQNQSGRQGREENGRSNRTGSQRGRVREHTPLERERFRTPQRILNYSV